MIPSTSRVCFDTHEILVGVFKSIPCIFWRIAVILMVPILGHPFFSKSLEERLHRRFLLTDKQVTMASMKDNVSKLNLVCRDGEGDDANGGALRIPPMSSFYSSHRRDCVSRKWESIASTCASTPATVTAEIRGTPHLWENKEEKELIGGTWPDSTVQHAGQH
jgi:hypothetical protein